MTKIEGKPALAVKDLFAQSPDGLREVVRAVLQEVLEAEMTETVGAEKGAVLSTSRPCLRRPRTIGGVLRFTGKQQCSGQHPS